MVPKHKLKPGSSVEVSIDCGGGIYGSWFTATIVEWVSSDKLLVNYDDLDVKPTTVDLHQLRPVPSPESHWEFKIGDKVEAFRKQRWWEGYVREVIGNGRLFIVCCNDSKEMMFSKELVRVHRQWINNNWVPPITESSLTYRKELRMERRRQRRANKRNMIDELPDCILLHIMSFLKAQEAVQTCILSKRWKDLCKHVTTLTYIPSSAKNLKSFKSWVMFIRDHSCSLINLTIDTQIQEDEEDIYTLIQYALLHNIQQLKIQINQSFTPKYELLPLISASHSLTILHLSYPSDKKFPILPKSFHLPALRTLHLECVYFVSTHNHCADPFSNCYVLNTLVLSNCSLVKDAQVLCISNHTLSNLTISYVSARKFLLSTPNLSSFTISGITIFQNLLSSTCNLSFLHQVNMDGLSCDGKTSIFLRWLQVLADVKILKFDNCVIQTILQEFRSKPITKKAQPPCFVRLESLTVNKSSIGGLRDEEIMEVVEHLLQNTTPMPRVHIINLDSLESCVPDILYEL